MAIRLELNKEPNPESNPPTEDDFLESPSSAVVCLLAFSLTFFKMLPKLICAWTLAQTMSMQLMAKHVMKLFIFIPFKNYLLLFINFH